MKGTVKWFNRKKGYGFITGEDGNDIFVHFTAIAVDGFKTLNEGDSVTYEIGSNEKGTTALNVVPA